MPLRPVPAAAYLVNRNPGLIRRWVYTGRLTHTACDTRTRALLVDVAETVHLSAAVQKRRAA